MPEECLVISCRACDWHVVRGQKLECNFKNRLGLTKPGLGEFAGGLPESAIDEKKAEQIIKEAERLKELAEEIKKRKGEESE